jgi:hypothetical protein
MGGAFAIAAALGLRHPPTCDERYSIKAASCHFFLAQLSQIREDVRSEHVLQPADRWLKLFEREAPRPDQGCGPSQPARK